MNAKIQPPHQNISGARASLKTALGDMYRGFFGITHNGLALMGTVLAVGLITLGTVSYTHLTLPTNREV